MQTIIVAKKGTRDFDSIQDAIDSIRVYPLSPVTIWVDEGIYDEIITIPENKPNITIIGKDSNKTIIKGRKYARMNNEKGVEIGTFQTGVVHIFANEVTFKNITIQNEAGFGSHIGQALALYTAGDKCAFHQVRLLGNQDTLFISKGRHYFNRCYIEGHVDFIFGAGTAVFEHCEIHSLRNGYITAASTPSDQQYGFIFINCKLTCSSAATAVYLGRPWRPFAHTAFIHTWMGPHIHPAGWDNWGNQANENTARFFENGSTGPGANLVNRVSWAKTFSTEEISTFTLEQIFKQYNTWIPSLSSI